MLSGLDLISAFVKSAVGFDGLRERIEEKGVCLRVGELDPESGALLAGAVE